MKKMLLLSAAAAALTMGAAQAADLKFTPGEGDFNWASYEALKATQLDGEQVTVFGPWLGPDQAAPSQVLAYFAEAATGADVRYVGSDSFEQQIMVDAEAGSAPNIAVFPQPGLAADMAARGFLTPLRRCGTGGWSGKTTPPASPGSIWAPMLVRTADNLYGFFYKVDVKSLVWYMPENFEDAGYEIPAVDGRAEGADRADRCRWRNAVVHRSGIGRCHRLAGDRLGRGHDAAHPAARRL
jgi:alpha-glucoside transport system substrate-binding protein